VDRRGALWGPGGLILSDKAAWRVRYSGDAARLLEGIRQTLPGDANVYLEGSRNPAVVELLKAHPAAAVQKIQVGTLWPRTQAYHVANHDPLMAALTRLAATLATPELADHLVVYRGEHVLVSAYDLGDEELWILRDMGEEQIRALLDAIGGTIA
jgi:hypothetical protein